MSITTDYLRSLIEESVQERDGLSYIVVSIGPFSKEYYNTPLTPLNNSMRALRRSQLVGQVLRAMYPSTWYEFMDDDTRLQRITERL